MSDTTQPTPNQQPPAQSAEAAAANAQTAAQAATQATQNATDAAISAQGTGIPVSPADLAAQAKATSEPIATAADTGNVDELPAWAREQITKANAEAAKYRTRAKEIEDAKQAEFDALKQQFGKAFGYEGDTETEDPAKLLETATKEREEMASKLREYRQSDAINAAAGAADKTLLGALLKSDNAFNALDMSADDYNAQVASIVKQKLAEHPSLTVQVTAGQSGVDTSATNTGADRPLTREDLATMGDDEINAAVKAGKLTHLLTGGK